MFAFLWVSALPFQVAAPPKKKRKTEEEKPEAEVVKPGTWSQRATSLLSSLLADAASARTSSIKLNDMEYAGELSTQLLDHAKSLEALYQSTSKALAEGSEDKVLKGFVNKAHKLDEFGAKAQAWIPNHLPN